jgi:hypothetical protein
VVPGHSGSAGCKAALAALLHTAVASAGWRVTQSNAFQSQKAFLDNKFMSFLGLVFTVSALGFANPVQVTTMRALLAVSA